MPHKLKIAAIQMDATPAPTPERLSRAECLLEEAVTAGAELVVLPEIFNLGYHYHDDNFRYAEPINGQTPTWMRRMAEKHKIHIAGTFLLRDGDEVYNTALLIAPDGRTWRYDKNYPWGWERAYFRDSETITIADTDLGNFGMMICWDYAHPELWHRYAGQVDAIIIMSCPPAVDKMRLAFPSKQMKMGGTYYNGADMPFGSDMDLQAAWMRVPVINTTGSGLFSSHVPRPFMSLLGGSLTQPRLLGNFLQAKHVKVEADYYQQTKIVNAHGYVVSRVDHAGDQLTLGEIELADQTPRPIGPQPKLPYTRLAYFFSDVSLPWLMLPVYRWGYRRAIGRQMAPVDRSTRFWQSVVLGAFSLGWFMGRFVKRKGNQ